MSTTALAPTPRLRVDATDWPAVAREMNGYGSALTSQVLTAAECRDIADLYDEAERFRSTIDMAR